MRLDSIASSEWPLGAILGLTLQSYARAAAGVFRHEYDAALFQRALNRIAVGHSASLRPSIALDPSYSRKRNPALVRQRLLAPIQQRPSSTYLTSKKHYFRSHAF